ncbi:MAG TPA: DeoR family transcriptional regulator, partial [Gammaproteobacteria bacterium]|nr:DeoR family transcriptional regulator [Gammaproteobacteria bacterium]
VDHAIIGASAIDEEGALLDFDYREVRVSQAIIGNARQVILVSDRLKFERSAPVRIGHISQIDVFVTDELSSEPVAELCRTHGVRVIETRAQENAAD